MWPVRKLILTGIEGDDSVIEFRMDNIAKFASGETPIAGQEDGI